MQKNCKPGWSRPKLGVTAVCLAMAGQVWAADDGLPSMGESNSSWNTDVTYENHTVRREHVGLAKFRNTLQVETDKQMGNGWAVHGIFRGSWDGVYRMNSDEYGKKAGGPIMLESTGMPTGEVPHGGGLPRVTPQSPVRLA